MRTLLRIPFVFWAFALLPLCTLSADLGKKDSVRSSILKGTWYAGNKEMLTKQVDDLVRAVPEPSANPNHIRAIIAPHAGYAYSGPCAAYSYRPLVGTKYKRVIILAPSHHAAFPGGSIDSVNACETPLGQTLFDREACDSLLKSDLIKNHPEAHEQEHSIEIQLPFLQRVLGDFKLIPIVLGEITPEQCIALADLIRPLLDRDTLLVMSSDFTHQGPRFDYIPFKDKVKENIQRLDFMAVNHILNLDVRGFWIFLNGTKATICGRNPIKIGMMALPLQTQVEFVHYETSGDKTRDYSETVSYCALVFRERTDYLDENETGILLQAARNSLEETFKISKPKEYAIPDAQITERLKQMKGVFVTLQKKGELRGCIGHLEGDQPLYRAVPSTVLLSAFSDNRFEPLKKNELTETDIEISSMSPMTPIASWKEIVLGRDGVVLEKNGRQALFLPQVALEQGWNVEETLDHLSQKAGLNADAWKSDCNFKTFTAQVFGETFKNLKPEKR